MSPDHHETSIFQAYLIDSPKMLHIRNVAKVLKSNEEGEDEVATLTVNYFTANQDAANSYVKVKKTILIHLPMHFEEYIINRLSIYSVNPLHTAGSKGTQKVR